MRRLVINTLLSVAAVVCVAQAAAQNMPERSLVRKGNRHFAKERYDRSADLYRRALECDSTSFEAAYDLAGAMIRTERYDEAERLLASAAADSLRSDADRAEAYYNLGNAQFAQQKLQEALRSYRRSLTLNPDDMEAKYNYAYTKKLLENQDQNQDPQQDQNQDQNRDQNQDQQNQGGGGGNDQNQDKNDDGGQDKDDGRGDDKNDDKNDDKGDGDPSEQKAPPRSGMSEQQQRQLLDAIQAQEDKTQEKLDEKAKGVVVRGRKNW